MGNIKCEMCGRSVQSVPHSYFVEYGVWLCNDCLSSVVETNKNLFGKAFTENLFEHCKSVCIPYNKIKEENQMKVKVRRNEKKEIEVDIDDLRYNDEFDISKNGEVIAVGTVADVWTNKGVRRANVDLTFTKESKTWEDLGYDCFEDMIDDIAAQHKGEFHNVHERDTCFIRDAYFLADTIEALDPDQAALFAEDLCNYAKKGHGLKLYNLCGAVKFAQRFKEEHPLYKYVPVEPAKFIRNEERLKWLRHELTPDEIKWVKDMYRDCAHPNYKHDPEYTLYPEFVAKRYPYGTCISEHFRIADSYGECFIIFVDEEGNRSKIRATEASVYTLVEEEDRPSIDEEDRRWKTTSTTPSTMRLTKLSALRRWRSHRAEGR